ESYFPGLMIADCTGCSFENFSIDYEHLPFTQLTVTQVSEQHQFIRVQPVSGWPNPQQLYNHQSAQGPVSYFLGFDTRNGAPLYGYTRWELPHCFPDAHRIPLDPEHVIKEGDVFIVSARGGGPAIRMENSQSSTFKGITIYTSGGPAVE